MLKKLSNMKTFIDNDIFPLVLNFDVIGIREVNLEFFLIFFALSLSLILYYFILVLLGCLCELIVRPSSIYRSSHIINQKICFLFFLLASSSWIYFEGVMTCRRYKKLNFINLTSANCYLIFIFIINSSNFMLNWISAEILSH